MNDGTEKVIKNITLSYLQDTKAGDYLQKAMEVMQKAQEVAYAYASDDSPKQLKEMKIGTTLAFSIVSKIAEGKPIKSFTAKDWEDIASNVADYAILADGRQWSVIVFSIYANYVDVSANVLEKRKIPQSKCDAIRALAITVRKLEKDLLAGKISEVVYTEKCLWILLEAMVKLLSTYSTLLVGENAGEFLQSVSMLAFEYGRYTLYKQEQDILDSYIRQQRTVDEDLQLKLDSFNRELQKRQEEFNCLIKDAFTPDVMARFRTSVELARNAGVADKDILTTSEQVDDFFNGLV